MTTYEALRTLRPRTLDRYWALIHLYGFSTVFLREVFPLVIYDVRSNIALRMVLSSQFEAQKTLEASSLFSLHWPRAMHLTDTVPLLSADAVGLSPDGASAPLPQRIWTIIAVDGHAFNYVEGEPLHYVHGVLLGQSAFSAEGILGELVQTERLDPSDRVWINWDHIPFADLARAALMKGLVQQGLAALLRTTSQGPGPSRPDEPTGLSCEEERCTHPCSRYLGHVGSVLCGAGCALAIGRSRPHGCLACLEENQDHLYDPLTQE